MATNEQVLAAVAKSAIAVNQSDLGILKITGATRLDLIHRMSTQAVKDLKAGEGAATVLTSDIARILDRLVLAATDEAVYALTGAGNGDAVARYLMRYVFFNDDFHINDLSGQEVVWGIYGWRATAVVATLGMTDELELFHWREGMVAGETVMVQKVNPIDGGGYLVRGSLAAGEALAAHWATVAVVVATDDQFEMVRIQAGQPQFGSELTEAYIPLEANLWGDVSFQKGCYIGQEIIARMESRGKLAKRLVRLASGGRVRAGEGLIANGKKVGKITSAAVVGEKTVALGYVRTKALASEATLATAMGVVVTVVGE